MHIGIVGGVERNESVYREVARRHGHSVVFHGGHMGGRGTETLAAMVHTVDLLVVITEINSHTAVGVARREARARGVPLLLVRRFGTAKLAAIFAEHATQALRAS